MICMPIAGATAEAVPGNIETFCLFGNPVAQSLSPLMHSAAFAKMGLMAVYTAYRATDAAEVVRMVRDRGIRGASITIPFKETVMAFLDEVDENAPEIGAVNTIINRGGRLIGIQHGRSRAGPRPGGMDRNPGKDLHHPRRRRSGPGGRLRAHSGGRHSDHRQPDGRRGPEALADRFGCRWGLLRRSAVWRRTV